MSLLLAFLLSGLQPAPPPRTCAFRPNWGPALRGGLTKEIDFLDERNGEMRWNGTSVTEEELRRALITAAEQRGRKIIIIGTRELATCERLRELQELVEAIVPCDRNVCLSGPLLFQGPAE